MRLRVGKILTLRGGRPLTSWTASFRSVWCGVSERVCAEYCRMQGGVQEGWAASDNVDGGLAGVEGGAGRGASRRMTVILKLTL